MAIVGAGISGLACAYFLQKKGFPALLLEKKERAGGVIQTEVRDGFLFELGPQSFLGTPAVRSLCDDLGLGGQLVQADSSARRYVLSGGRLHRLPMGPPALIRTGLLSPKAKWLLFTEPFRSTQPPESDETVASFVRRKFGETVLENLAAPFVSGVYAGDPEQLSLRSAFPMIFEWEKQFGSVVGGALRSGPKRNGPRPALCSFRKGLATLTDALAAKLGDTCRLGVENLSITRAAQAGNRGWMISLRRGAGPENVLVDGIVFATPTQASATLLADLAAGMSRALFQIRYAPIVLAVMGYRREQIAHPVNGFGFLVGAKEQRQVLGTVWNSSLFPERAPSGMVCMTTFLGGAMHPEVSSLGDSRICEIVGKELGEILGVRGKPVTQVVHRQERAIPQYNVGHSEVLAELNALTKELPGVFLTGNYLRGPSIGACIEEAERTASAVSEYLRSVDQAKQ